jgi:hypothetical protein
MPVFTLTINMNFFQFFDKLNSKQPEQNEPPPGPNLANMDLDTKGYDLKPLSQEDMGRAAAEDVEKAMWEKQARGENNTRLGDPMTDDELQKFMGLS